MPEAQEIEQTININPKTLSDEHTDAFLNHLALNLGENATVDLLHQAIQSSLIACPVKNPIMLLRGNIDNHTYYILSAHDQDQGILLRAWEISDGNLIGHHIEPDLLVTLAEAIAYNNTALSIVYSHKPIGHTHRDGHEEEEHGHSHEHVHEHVHEHTEHEGHEGHSGHSGHSGSHHNGHSDSHPHTSHPHKAHKGPHHHKSHKKHKHEGHKSTHAAHTIHGEHKTHEKHNEHDKHNGHNNHMNHNAHSSDTKHSSTHDDHSTHHIEGHVLGHEQHLGHEEHEGHTQHIHLHLIHVHVHTHSHDHSSEHIHHLPHEAHTHLGHFALHDSSHNELHNNLHSHHEIHFGHSTHIQHDHEDPHNTNSVIQESNGTNEEINYGFLSGYLMYLLSALYLILETPFINYQDISQAGEEAQIVNSMEEDNDIETNLINKPQAIIERITPHLRNEFFEANSEYYTPNQALQQSPITIKVKNNLNQRGHIHKRQIAA